MTITEILTNASQALIVAQTLPVGDPRVTTALSLLGLSIDLMQSLHRQGLFNPDVPIEVDEIGLKLVTNMQAQWRALGVDDPMPDRR